MGSNNFCLFGFRRFRCFGVLKSLGHLTWPLTLLCFFLCFPFFVFNDEDKADQVFPPKISKPFWFIYLCFALFLFSLLLRTYLPPFFPFSFKRSLNLLFFSSFVPVFHFSSFWFLLRTKMLYAALFFQAENYFCLYFSACCLVLF